MKIKHPNFDKLNEIKNDFFKHGIVISQKDAANILGTSKQNISKDKEKWNLEFTKNKKVTLRSVEEQQIKKENKLKFVKIKQNKETIKIITPKSDF